MLLLILTFGLFMDIIFQKFSLAPIAFLFLAGNV